MKIIFTICSNNYLAQAKALGDSLAITNPDYQFFIGLVDILSLEIDYEVEIGHKIIPAAEIGILDFDKLYEKYNIIELNTCVKPFYLKYFTQRYSDLSYLMYFDPDTFIFEKLLKIENELSNGKEIILTPHILTPVPLDGKMPNENLFLNFGTFNLGFIGIKNPLNNLSFFDWWGERTYEIGFDRVSEGLFVDQLWMNLTPIFFDNVVISKNYGLNMGPWNLHERYLSKNQNQNWFVNGKQELIFYHFSNYKYNAPQTLASYYNRFAFSDRPDLTLLYEDYLKILLENNISKLSNIYCEYVMLRNKFLSDSKPTNQKKSLRRKIRDRLIQILK